MEKTEKFDKFSLLSGAKEKPTLGSRELIQFEEGYE